MDETYRPTGKSMDERSLVKNALDAFEQGLEGSHHEASRTPAFQDVRKEPAGK